MVLSGTRDEPAPGRPARPADWADAIAAAQLAAAVNRVALTVSAGAIAPWHPGRCAALHVGDVLVGHAGELHPGVIAALDLPARTCAVELDLDALGRDDRPIPAPALSVYPPALLDIALVVDEGVPQSAVEAALRSGAGELLESVELFDIYRDDRVGAGRKSLAYALRLRAPDRTLTAEEATAARDAAVAAAAAGTGAAMRA